MSITSFNLAAQHLIHSTKVTLFALVDGLQYERYFCEELSEQQYVSMPLFDSWPDSRIAFAGPWLIDMNRKVSIRTRLCELEINYPSVSWVITSLTLPELINHFKNHMSIQLPNGKIGLLRFYDPRVQVRLGGILEDMQHYNLIKNISGWYSTTTEGIYSLDKRMFITL